jgi:hypothetical protein
VGAFLILAGAFFTLLGAMALFSNLTRRSYGAELLMKVSFTLGALCIVAGFAYFKIQPYK